MRFKFFDGNRSATKHKSSDEELQVVVTFFYAELLRFDTREDVKEAGDVKMLAVTLRHRLPPLFHSFNLCNTTKTVSSWTRCKTDKKDLNIICDH